MKKNLAAVYYTDPSQFHQERRRLFSESWQLVGHVSEVQQSGEFITADIAGIKVIVIRGKDGVLRGFRNVCRHRGAQLLTEDKGRCNTIRCPYHHWVYSTDGSLVQTPWFGEDGGFNQEDWPLETVSIEEWRGLLFVCVEPNETSIEQLGDGVSEFADIPIEQFSLARQETLTFTGNWKIYTDNFVEGYHIPGIHPDFFNAIDFEKFETTAHRGMVKMTAPAKENLFYKGRWYWMWPNWTLSLFHGGMNTSRINPINERQTELIYHFYFDAEHINDKDFQSQTIHSNLEVIRQDFQICLDTHNNYASGGYQSGPLSPRHEQGVVYFQEKYKESVGL